MMRIGAFATLVYPWRARLGLSIFLWHQTLPASRKEVSGGPSLDVGQQPANRVTHVREWPCSNMACAIITFLFSPKNLAWLVVTMSHYCCIFMSLFLYKSPYVSVTI